MWIELSCGLRLYSALRVLKWQPWSLTNAKIVFLSSPVSTSVLRIVPTVSSILATQPK